MIYSKKIFQAPENTFALGADGWPIKVLAYVHEELIHTPQENDREIESEIEEVWAIDQFGESHLLYYPLAKGISRKDLEGIEKCYEESRLKGLNSSDWQEKERFCKLPFKKYCELIGFDPEKYIYDEE